MVAHGLGDVVVAQTCLSRVESQAARLSYPGYDVRDLAQNATFEEVAYLFWYGELPNRCQLADLQAALARSRALPGEVFATARALPTNTEPMDALRTLVSALGAKAKLEPPDIARAITLTAQMPVLVAAFDCVRRGLEPLAPRPELNTAANFLYLLHGEDPPEEQARALDGYLVLLADQAMTTSTFAARVVASTGSDLYSCITAALAALKGPLHGGSPARVLDMVEAIGTKDNAESWMRAALSRGERLMGFGQKMYATADPRVEPMRHLAQQVSPPDFFELASHIQGVGEELLPRDPRGQPLAANVEFYSAILLHALGLPKDLFTPIFAIARTVGWTAHVLEQRSNNHLIRPAVEYVGPAARKVKVAGGK